MEKNKDTRHNGWSNFETWAVHLWLTNEKPNFERWRNRTEEILRESPADEDHLAARVKLAEEIQEAVHQECEVKRISLASDLLNAALGEVDWFEIAAEFVEDYPLSSPKADGPIEDDLIFACSRHDALNYGVLIDASDMAHEAGFRVPVALTSAAWAKCVTIPPGVDGQDEGGRLWDVLIMLFVVSRRRSEDESVRLFEVLVQNDDSGPKLVRLKAVCGPNDDLTPCITIMLPEED